MIRFNNWWKLMAVTGLAAGLVSIGSAPVALSQVTQKPTDQFPDDGLLTIQEILAGGGPVNANDDGRGGDSKGKNGSNVFVNDPCLDPPPHAPFPENFRRTVQSETEIAVLDKVDGDEESDDKDSNDSDSDGSGKLMVAGYNDSFGFYDNRQGLSGFSYSTNGGKLWIDAGGLPPLIPTGAPAGSPGHDRYFGDPVIVVHHRTKKFYYASIYQSPDGHFTLSVNRGEFRVAPQQVPVESKANTRCEGNPALNGIPDPPPFVQKRIIWDPPVEAVLPPFLNNNQDFLDKEWLYVDQKTGFLYMTYTRFGADGSTPIEMVRSFDQGQTWTPPSVIVPNLDDTFNQATQPVVTPTGRVIVTWFARTFPAPTFVERNQRIEVAFSDDGGNTFGAPVLVADVNPQGEPPGYNRGRATILNAPYINVDKGRDDGVMTEEKKQRPGFGNVYITYFDGLTPFAKPPGRNPPFASAAEIHLSASTTNGTTWGPEVKVNDDNTQTSHVFPSVQVNKRGQVFVTWIDRRVDPVANRLNDTWGDISNNRGISFGGDQRITTVSADWFTRADARPNFGDYNSSAVIHFTKFCSIWADGRFPPGTGQITPLPRPPRRLATPDTLFSVFKDGSGGDGD